MRDEGRDAMAEQSSKLEAEANAFRNWGRASQSRPRMEAAVALARSRGQVLVMPDMLDREPTLFNVLNGTIDLTTGEIRPHRRKDMLTKLCPLAYDPDATAPTWDRFLLEIMEGKENLVAYLRRVFGYAVTGDVREDALWIFHGGGANGKTTLLEAVASTMGPDYAATLAPELLLVKRNEPHPTGLADLHGKRLAYTHEVEEGRRLAEGLVKQLTGRDRIKARHMREDFWEFEPTHKIILATNHKPEIRGGDLAIWRRIRLVPFEVTFPEDRQDKDLPTKLSAERVGILAWLVRGAMEWHRKGLEDPLEVRAATEAYREEADPVGDFLAERCVAGNDLYRVRAAELYEAFVAWDRRSGGGDPMSGTAFGRRITERFSKVKESSGLWYVGVALRDQRNEDEPPF